MAATLSNLNPFMLIREYIAPEITLFHYSVEQGFGVSDVSPDFNIGIGGWESENEEESIY